MTLLELRRKATDLANKIVAARDAYNTRKDAGEDLWPGETRQEWSDLNKQYNETLEAIKASEAEARVMEEAAAAEDWLQRSTADPNRRPTLDEQAPGGGGATYGDLGLSNRDQARALEQRERDLCLAWRTWTAWGIPDTVHDFHHSEQHRDACQRIQFNPSCGTINLRHLDTEPYKFLQRQLDRVHPDCREGQFERIIAEMENRAGLKTGLGSSGGYISVPAAVVRAIELAMIEFGTILQVADTITTETGEEISWPYADDTSNEGAYVGESSTLSTTSVDPAFEQVKWRAYDITSKFIRVSFRTFRDTFANLEVLLGRMIGERIGRKLSGECTTGAAKIRGLITRAPVGQTTAGATAITYDDIVGLEHSVDPANRGMLRFMFHDAVCEHIRLIKDGDGRPLFISNVAQMQPDTINGRQFVINQKMDSSVATTNKTMVAGDLQSYKVRRVGPALRVKRLVERFAENDETAFIGYTSVDGNLLRPNQDAASPVQVLQQA